MEKNALIINGRVYKPKRVLNVNFLAADPCAKCALYEKCSGGADGYYCAPFERKNYIVNFVEVKNGKE